jgi:hypothetical protein
MLQLQLQYLFLRATKSFPLESFSGTLTLTRPFASCVLSSTETAVGTAHNKSPILLITLPLLRITE